MLDIGSVGPVVFLLSAADIVLHIYLDFKKVRRQTISQSSESDVRIPTRILLVVGVTTILSFILVFVFSLIWILNLNLAILEIFVPFIDPPILIWITGLLVLSAGILLHGWSRFVRNSLASNWEMNEEHPLFTYGPYARIRHPSYTSYFLSFIGLFLLVPSLLTILPIIGIWGYNQLAVKEEEHLLKHFGNEYSQYMTRTGRFLPSIRIKSSLRDSPKA